MGRVAEAVTEVLAEVKTIAPERRIPAPPGNSLKCFEYEAQLWRLYGPVGALPSDVELAEFWSNLDTSRFKLFDKVSVVEESAWTVDAVIVDLTPGLPPAVKVTATLYRQERQDLVTNGVHPDFDVEFDAVTSTWLARRKSNGVVLVEMMPSKEDLRRAVLDHATVRQGLRAR